MISQQKRIHWVDSARGFCIFFVMMTHADKAELTIFPHFFRPFFIPLFFVVSGYLFNANRNWKDFLQREWRGLIVPYLCISFFWFLLKSPLALYRGQFLNYVVDTFYDIMTGRIYWFVACLCVVQLGYFILHKIYLHKANWYIKLATATLFLLTIFYLNNSARFHLWWNADTALYAMGYFILGAIIKETNFIIKNVHAKSRCISFLLLLLYIVLSYSINWSAIGLDYDLHNNNFGLMPFVNLLLSLISCSVVLYVCMNFNLGLYIKLLGEYSIVVYFLSGTGFTILNFIIFGLGLSNVNMLYPNLYYLSYCFLAGIFSIICAKLLNKYAPATIGKKR